ncbi:Druantia anti-phage system protein DruA [Desulfosporosinus sp. BICA1-9]|uniref:Druantia anti-phage system protein DruA n=1 Tax=Desulfosporosinus sp. BICA1-9 TaxID=1531958 RepID=UPI00054BA66D|nr:Druantia anti-phage system protein DruA [Desulfosporosinus sp. BICA1-9]KJS46566.1 MAG: hypothetical protein VR66_24700 [Peptococcaceae bacterium BRH_c23]KJS84237.1 MAG: hypothetical protein JL57_20990 [Desulfosporosinus sp. BICA1-9]HBW37685.1 DUF4338 domain-containing protein [Desulfosporosinus sp.]
MDKIIMIYYGRNFTSEEIELIQWTRKRYPQLSRKELASTVCEFLGWTTPAGYKASNWTYLGETQGRGRMDRKNEYALSRKAIYMYPLQKDFKDCLKGIKPCKTVNPDD